MSRTLFLLGCICLLCWSQKVAQTSVGEGALEFRAARTTPAVGYPIVKSLNGTPFYVSHTTLFSADDFESAKVDTSAANGILLVARLQPRADARFQEFTKHHVGEYLAILLNGELVGTPPRIMDPVSKSTFLLSGLPPAEAQRIAAAVTARNHSGP